MSTEIHGWYEFALAQIAADSYLDQLVLIPSTNEEVDALEERLRNGANHYTTIEQNTEDDNLSATRMTEEMINDFFRTWNIIDHQDNAKSGFSATLLQHKTTGEFTLSFRSTESKDPVDGGDVERDSSNGANGQIKETAFAFGQILDMEKYYQTLKDNGLIPNNTQINITGYSLGGHLAQIFTALHYDEVIHTYTFNGAGFGDFSHLGMDATIHDYRINIEATLFGINDALSSPVDYINRVSGGQLIDIINKLSVQTQIFDLLTPNLAEKVSAQLLLSDEDKIQLVTVIEQYHDSIDLNNIYLDPLFLYAIQANIEGLVGVEVISSLELIHDINHLDFTREQIIYDDKISNLFGHNIPGDDRLLGEFVAGSGQIFGEYLPIYIEDQPVFDFTKSTEFMDSFLRSFGPGHSITLLVDTLAVMDVMSTLDSSLSRVEMNQIFASASNSERSTIITDLIDTIPLIPDTSRAEGDSLEIILDKLGKLFLPDAWVNTTVSHEPGAYSDLELRNEFYGQIKSLRDVLFDNNELKPEHQSLKIEYVSGFTNSISELKLRSEGNPLILTDPSDSIAYRYALVNLNPFVITGNPALYEKHNQNGELDLFDEETKQGALTSEYLEDRAAFLLTAIDANLNNNEQANAELGEKYIDAVFVDKTIDHDNDLETDYELHNQSSIFTTDNYIIFGKNTDDNSEVIRGESGDDSIYGGLGDDKLGGGEGSDYIEGGHGDDRLYGGTLTVPQTHEDDNTHDLLKGGLGNDRYYVGHLDEIEDADNSEQSERIDFDGIDVRGIYEKQVKGVYKNESNDLLLTKNGRNAVIKQVSDNGTRFFTINNFWDENDGRGENDFGITLDEPVVPEASETYIAEFGVTLDKYIVTYPDVDAGAGSFTHILGNNSHPNEEITNFVSDLGEFINISESPGIKIEARDGHDQIVIDNLYNKGWLVSNSNPNVLLPYDGTNPDNLSFYYTPTLNAPGNLEEGVIVDAGAGNDLIEGGADDDFLLGGNGNDLINGQDGNDVINGGDGDDTLGSTDFWYGEGYTDLISANDIIIGGKGNDVLTDHWGNDVLIGGDDNDYLSGGAGKDTLLGGEGDDVLEGGTLVTANHPTRYWLSNFNEKGQPTGVLLSDISSSNVEGDEDDYLNGGAGRDILFGGAGNDHLIGGTENDLLRGDEGNDLLEGGQGNDLLIGDLLARDGVPLDAVQKHGNDILKGNEGDDDLIGLGGEDELYGGDGNDNLDGDGADIEGAAHRDDFLDGGSGDDQLVGNGGSDTLLGGSGNDVLTGDANELAAEFHKSDTLFGGSGDDYLYGFGGDDILDGGEGIDHIYGGKGDDIITFDENDIVDGGEGDDVYIVGSDITHFDLEDASGSNTISFSENISFSDISLNREGDTLSIQTPTSTLSIANWSSGSFNHFRFSDNSEANATEIELAINDQPELNSSITNQLTDEDSVFTFQLPANLFIEPENDTLAYSATLTDDSPLPAWLSINPETGELTGTPENNDVGEISIKVTATDTGGLSESVNFNLTVNNTNDTPEISLALSDSEAVQNFLFEYQIPVNSFVEPDVSDSLVYSATLANGDELPGWLNFDAENLIFTGVPREPDLSVLDIKVTATDLSGESVSDEFQLNVVDSSEQAITSRIRGNLSVFGTFRSQGISVSNAGDINNDGFNDVLIGSVTSEQDGVATDPRAYVVYGKEGGLGNQISLDELNGENGFIFEGITAEDGSEILDVTSLGDVNGDGIDDFGVGYRNINQASVVFGSNNGFDSTVNINELTENSGFNITGAGESFSEEGEEEEAETSGNLLTSAGDINGDGYSDILISARGFFSNDSYIIFGNESGSIASNVENLDGSNGFKLNGNNTGVFGIGSSLSTSGDINNDGYDDFIIGGYGASYVVFGQGSNFANEIDLMNLNGNDGFLISGGNSTSIVSRLGDINNDGFDDIGVHMSSGIVNVIYGDDGNYPATIDINSINLNDGFSILSDASIISGGGDINSDGMDDFVIGLDDKAYVVYGQSEKLTGDINIADITGDSGYQITLPRNILSASMSPDINGDDIADILLGTNGETHVIYGSNSEHQATLLGTSDDDELELDDSNLIIEALEGDDQILITGGTNITVNSGAGDDTITVNIGANSGDVMPNFSFGLFGGAGADKYSIYTGTTSGVIHVNDYFPSQQNIMQFNDILDPSNIQFGLGSLKLSFTDNNVEIHLENFDPNDVYGGPRDIDIFEFQNITLSYEELLAQGFDIKGTASDDIINGTNIEDRIYGFEGDDEINSGEGNDSLDGGAGNDLLQGGAGNDIYFYNEGDGKDQIVDLSGVDKIHFGTGVLSSSLIVNFSGDDLEIDINQTDSILIKNWLIDSSDQIEQFIFEEENNLLLSASEIETMVQIDTDLNIINGTDNNDFLKGSSEADKITGMSGNDIIKGKRGDDILSGGSGNDRINGGRGDDVISGGTGDDILKGRFGNDVYEFELNWGKDKLVNRDPDQNSVDTIRFAQGISPDDITFRRKNHHLFIDHMNGQDRIKLKRYFDSSDYQIDQLEFSDGTVLLQPDFENLSNLKSGDREIILSNQVNLLTQALAGFDVDNPGNTDVLQHLEESFHSDIAVSWGQA